MPKSAAAAGILAVLVSPVLLSATPAGAADPARAVLRLHVKAGVARARLVEALRGAQRRLRSPVCQELLDDFEAVSGGSLRERLHALGLEAPDFLGHVTLYDGTATRLCQTSRIAAATTPGSRVVWVCAGRFERVTESRAEAILIHEMLHSLGLGERPPAPEEIDDRVRQRCFASAR